MSTNNLYHYIKTGAFLHEIKNAPASIVWEKIPDRTLLPDTHTNHICMSDLGYDFRIDGTIAQYIQKHPSVYIILDTIGLGSCIDMLFLIASHPDCRIINLGVGISGVQNKHTLEIRDYELIGDILPVKEPVDTIHLIKLLQVGGSSYMRINHDEFPDALFIGDHELLYNETDISMLGFGYTGIGGTIITSPSLLSSVSHAIQYCKTTSGIGYDLFLHVGSRTMYSDILKGSLESTGKLIRIHDQVDNAFIAGQEKTALQKAKIQGEITIHMKHPTYTKITTILPEYMYEQIGLDADSLAKYLISLG